MPWGFAAAAVGTVAGAAIQGSAANSAADTQAAAQQAGIDEQKREFDNVQGLLKPYVDAGTGALTGYNGALGQYGSALQQLNNLTGANGANAQQTALTGLTSNPYYKTAMNLGQQSILQSASATGGLRGGNTTSTLGYLPSQVLTATMQQQIGNLGTSLSGIQGLMGGYGQLLGIGENAAAGTGNAGIQTGNNITALLGAQGASQAGGILGAGNAASGAINGFSTYLGSSGGQSALAKIFGSTATNGGFNTTYQNSYSGFDNPDNYG
ncbi:hypothetical protein C9I56_11150 [Paraburkholderia caribensis]|uniref:hypothetical protein n=1 Tax=Paraburkholderia caribensis TaxID=75105 RepID=UPI000D178B8B|nr:hypothetical protein [Paraburkholderia caribensis]PTB28839.1 hypothetical protein C9I56_11150 [Paraburkholderia caribensis]